MSDTRSKMSKEGQGGGDVGASSSNTAEEGPLFWTRDLDVHYLGKFSTAVMQANVNLEDYSQVELGITSTFVGIYDGHGGYQAAAHVRRNLTRFLTGLVTNTSTMSVDHLREAFLRTDESWIDKVDARFAKDKYIAARGTCCLVGVFWRRNLYLANVGDSRAIIGREVEGSARIEFQQLTRDDNVREPEVRAEVLALHPDEPDFIVEDAKGVYRIKGRIQVSKSIGDAYLKKARFNLDEVDNKFKLNTPVRDGNPAVSADPMTYTIPIGPQDRFVIFASDGLWDMMSNQDAADIVQEHPREGIAERLVIEGLTKQARKAGGSSYKEILTFRRDTGDRRRIHDDISVVVIFFDHMWCGGAEIQVELPKYSVRDGELKKNSNFNALDGVPMEQAIWRTIYLANLSHGTHLDTIYPLLNWPVQHIRFARDGLSCEILFYYQEDARDFVKLHQNNLELRSSICILCAWEWNYRKKLYLVDYNFTVLDDLPEPEVELPPEDELPEPEVELPPEDELPEPEDELPPEEGQ